LPGYFRRKSESSEAGFVGAISWTISGLPGRTAPKSRPHRHGSVGAQTGASNERTTPPTPLFHRNRRSGELFTGCVSRAALTLHVAQPALSQQMAELELNLGVPLLRRSARGTQPTTAGELLYREAISILGRVGQLAVGRTGDRRAGYDRSILHVSRVPKAAHPSLSRCTSEGDSAMLDCRRLFSKKAP